MLSPHYVYMGIKSGNEWSPYYNALPLSLFFGILQAGVQVALDDPFAFINEDDIDPRLVRMPIQFIEQYSRDCQNKYPCTLVWPSLLLNDCLKNCDHPLNQSDARQMT